MLNMLKNNWVYILFCVVYFILSWLILGFTYESFIMVLVLYTISLVIAFTPLGEKILKFIHKVRPLKTEQEKIYLEPIFEEVYSNALIVNPYLNKNIKLHITEDKTINAFAVGKTTIAVTQGAIDSLSVDELKGVLAHEFGHISNGDTKALLLNFIGNGIFSIFVLLIKGIFYLLTFVYSAFGLGADVLTRAINWVIDLILYIFLFIGQMILSINSRKNEYNADKFTLDCGYGNDILQSLYFLKDFSMGHKMSLKERLISSHPHITDRIEQLENTK